MRILLLSDVIPPENIGGAGKIVWELARGLRAAGHDVHLIASTRRPCFEEERDGIPTYHIHSDYRYRFNAYLALYNPMTLPHLRRLAARIQPDIANTHNLHIHLSYSSLTVLKRLGIPTVFNAHEAMPFAYGKLDYYVRQGCGCDAPPSAYRLPRWYNLRTQRLRYNPLRNLTIRRILSSAPDARVACSHALRLALEANGLPSFEVVHYGLPPDAMQASPQAVETLRDRLGLRGRKVIVFAGRLSVGKGSREMLAALARVAARVPEVALLTLTAATPQQQGIDGPEYADLRARHIVSGGWLDGEALAAAYQLADVVVFPSVSHDPFGLVNLDGMAAGKPVVATCYGGAREAVVDGETGYIVDPLKIDQFAERLTTLLLDAALAQRMGAAGRARFLAYFTRDHYVARTLAVYQRVLRRG